jgi:polygalacturonase
MPVTFYTPKVLIGKAAMDNLMKVANQDEKSFIEANTLLYDTNVMANDFGAVGDGVTDDTAAIQASMVAAEMSGGKVIFPPGVYVFNPEVEEETALWDQI